MKLRHSLLAALAVGGSFLPVVAAAQGKAANAVLLSKVKSLTLRKDKNTSHRRVSALPQV